MSNVSTNDGHDDLGAPKKGLPKISRKWVVLGIVAIVIAVLVCAYFAAIRALDNSIGMLQNDTDAYTHCLSEYGSDGGSVVYHIKISDDDDSGLIKTVMWHNNVRYRENGEDRVSSVSATMYQFENSKFAKKYADAYRALFELVKSRMFVVGRYVFVFPPKPKETESQGSTYERDAVRKLGSGFLTKCMLYKVLTFDFDDLGAITGF